MTKTEWTGFSVKIGPESRFPGPEWRVFGSVGPARPAWPIGATQVVVA
ncbi:MAG: hypothetical protein U0794_10310 [Isosphaeraceae bacterium]